MAMTSVDSEHGQVPPNLCCARRSLLGLPTRSLATSCAQPSTHIETAATLILRSVASNAGLSVDLIDDPFRRCRRRTTTRSRRILPTNCLLAPRFANQCGKVAGDMDGPFVT